MKGRIFIAKDYLAENKTALTEKIKESLQSVLPIILIVLVLCLTVMPVNTGIMLAFLAGTVLVTVGMGFFSLGADTSMTPIGSKIGTSLTKTKNLPLILIVSFILGFAITIAEPDLQVLAQTVPHINNTVLLATVGAGVGLFLAVCMFRVLKGIKLRWLLLAFYGIIFALATFADGDFLSIAFDSGGVTTGPMTVPFILALGLGVSHIRSDKWAESDSFGMVALCSIGPILSVLVLGFFYPEGEGTASLTQTDFSNTADIGYAYLKATPEYMKEMAVALLPIVVIFLLFQFLTIKMPKRSFIKTVVGILYTYVGLVLFLTGVNVGFSALGGVLGAQLASSTALKPFMVPLAMLIGWFIISAEPAVQVLEKQVEEVSSGAIPGKAIKLSLSVAVALAMGISMLRVLTGISILWFLIPGYVIALLLSFFVPEIYTAIAFDSGGVASGPMTATFMLQFFIGASTALGGNVLRDAFGVVAMVAMMPLLSIQIVGFISERSKKSADEQSPVGDYDIIELWEEK